MKLKMTNKKRRIKIRKKIRINKMIMMMQMKK